MASTTTGYKTVAGLFDSMQNAQRATEELNALGIIRDDISLIAGNESDKYSEYTSGSGEVGKGAASGAGAGAAIGGGLGLVAGLAALAIPGFGPVIAAGPIAAALAGAGVGAAGGAMVGGLTKAGIPESDARLYESGVRSGGVLVTVRAHDDLADQVADLLDRNGAREIDEDDTQSGENYTSGTPTNTLVDRDRVDNRTELTGDRSIPVVEEQLRVGKRQVGGRTVRVYSDVTERPVEENIQLRDEHVRVDRHAVNRPATEADFSAFREGTIELTETREEAVISKDARVVEEVVLGKTVDHREETIRDTVRRTDVRVEEDASGTTGRLTDTDATRKR